MRAMGSDAFEQFARAIEDAFFERAGGGAASFREALAAEEREAAGALGRATGVDDPALLARLAALGLIPLVEGAWADGVMDAKERDAVLASAVTSGIAEESASHRLLELWTLERPSPALLEAWRAFIGALVASLGARECANLRKKLIGRAVAVANAAGGLLDARPNISAEERAVLHDLDAAFEPEEPSGPSRPEES
jgi:hypothetical protein